MTSTEQLVAAALADAEIVAAHNEITIYADANVGGLAWRTNTSEWGAADSGGIGCDAECYGEGDLEAVISALSGAGYRVLR